MYAAIAKGNVMSDIFFKNKKNEKYIVSPDTIWNILHALPYESLFAKRKNSYRATAKKSPNMAKNKFSPPKRAKSIIAT